MCFGTGDRGRTGVFEILVLDRALRARITGGATREELQTAIEQSGSYRTMADSCRELVLNLSLIHIWTDEAGNRPTV